MLFCCGKGQTISLFETQVSIYVKWSSAIINNGIGSCIPSLNIGNIYANWGLVDMNFRNGFGKKSQDIQDLVLSLLGS